MKGASAFTVKIPNPCMENWSEMTPSEKGSFCDRCQKEVLDFTSMTDDQIFELLSNRKGKICGRIPDSKLRRTYTKSVKKDFKNTKEVAIAATLLTGILSTELHGKTAGFNNETHQPPAISEMVSYPNSISQELTEPKSKTIKGFIYDADLKRQSDSLKTNNEPELAGAIVTKVETNQVVNSGIKGEFLVTLPEATEMDSVTIEVVFLGYQKWTKRISLDDINKEQIVLLNADFFGTIGEIVVTERYLYSSIKSIPDLIWVLVYSVKKRIYSQ